VIEPGDTQVPVNSELTGTWFVRPSQDGKCRVALDEVQSVPAEDAEAVRVRLAGPAHPVGLPGDDEAVARHVERVEVHPQRLLLEGIERRIHQQPVFDDKYTNRRRRGAGL